MGTKKLFTPEEVSILRANRYTLQVTVTHIVYMLVLMSILCYFVGLVYINDKIRHKFTATTIYGKYFCFLCDKIRFTDANQG